MANMVSREAFDTAISDFHKADRIEKTAETLRKAARQTILDYWAVNTDEFVPSEDGKMMVGVGANQLAVSITVPVKKGLPSRFDDSKTDEAIDRLYDFAPGSVDAIFPAYRKFCGPEAVIAWTKTCPESATIIAGILMKYALPATPDESMTPRVSPVKAPAHQYINVHGDWWVSPVKAKEKGE